MLLLLIPAEMIKSIISEREELHDSVTDEVSSKWATGQLLNGPILTIPLLYEWMEGNEKKRDVKYLHILPGKLNISGTIESEKLKRSIYEVIVYRASLSINGWFSLNKKFDLANLSGILYDQAFLTMGISDLRGIEDQVNLTWQNGIIPVEPGSRIMEMIPSGVTADLPDISDDPEIKHKFKIELKLQGSENISFIPLGDETIVDIRSGWHSPSFNGNFLPDQRVINENGFNAFWKVLQLNRNFPQSWIGPDHRSNMLESAFGVDLILPVDDYQKSMRSAKYAVMTITLTFLMFFMVEILNKRKIHPFQYGLVGLAVILFYVLLLSISEHLHFNFAYLISAITIIALITLYSLSTFRVLKFSLLLGVTLTGIYGFLFVILQLSDYALLLGSIGLTLMLTAIMYLTRNINWYRLKMKNE
jgi:inner membrane protein